MTAQNPEVKCPQWSAAVAQRLLDEGQLVGRSLQATYRGVGFVARITRQTDDIEVWHGYPEAWDKMDVELKRRWLAEKTITRRDLRRFRTRQSIRDEFGGRLIDGS